MIQIELTEQEAGIFRKFRQYQEQFEILLQSGLFEAKKSVVFISKNDKGIITDIDINQKKYKRKAKELTNQGNALS